MTTHQLYGRRSSHFTRVALIFAHELDVPLTLVHVSLAGLSAVDYGGNPALKMPALKRMDVGGSDEASTSSPPSTAGAVPPLVSRSVSESVSESVSKPVFGSAATSGSASVPLVGTENICRALAALSPRPRRVVWPEDLISDLSRSAQELVWHAMAAQVQLIIGTGVGKLPAENIYFEKCRLGLEGALRFLDEHLHEALALLPAQRDLSVFEVTLFCLVEHLQFRPTLRALPYTSLLGFADAWRARPSSVSTVYLAAPSPPGPPPATT